VRERRGGVKREGRKGRDKRERENEGKGDYPFN